MANQATSILSILGAIITLVISNTANAGLDDCRRLPSPSHGAVQLVLSGSDQLLAVFSCDPGYAAVGQTVVPCSNGQWTEIPPLCASLDECEINDRDSQNFDAALTDYCPKLSSPRNGRMDTAVFRGRLDATFNCFHGYQLTGPQEIHCANGVWDSIKPECLPVDCGDPTVPANGTVEYRETTYKSKALYRCDECHELQGPEVRSCKPSGVWSKEPAVCAPMLDFPACDLPELPEGAFIVNEADYVEDGMGAVSCGQEVVIECEPSLELMGASVAVCRTNGSYSWQGEEPHCV